MSNPIELLTVAEVAFNAFGAEELAGSGFENEIPEAEFVLDNDKPEDTGGKHA